MVADSSTNQHHSNDELANFKSDPSSVEDKSPKKQSARRRAYAKRSCLKCREKKARCELPEESLTTPSSMTPLSHQLACHRCKVLSLDCIVWDGDRKRRPKVSSSSNNIEDDDLKSPPSKRIKKEPSSSRLPSSPPRSPGSLEQLAAAAARLSDQRRTYHDGAADMSSHAASASNDAPSSRTDAASSLASVQFFNPIVDDAATSSSTHSPASQRAYDRQRERTASSSKYADQSPRTSKPPTPGSAASPNFAASSAQSSSSTSNKAQPPGRTWTSLWRPMSVLIDYAAQQPSFTIYLLSRIDRNLTDLDILDLIPRQTLSYLKPFLRPYLLWHPHLPDLDHIYTEHRKRPTVSSSLLLSSMCLVACRHAMPLTDPLPTKLSTLVDQLGTQILLSTPRDLYTVQALELLLAHEPSLVGTSVAASAQAERGNGLLGESLLASALTVARGLDLDKAIDDVVDICRQPRPNDRKQAQQRRDLLARHMASASIWISLRIWEGHFSIVNSTVRPIQLDEMVAKAESMLAIDNDGAKIERMHRDPFQSIEQRFPGLDEDSILRSAGRTGLIFRLQAMARFQDTIAGFYRILASAKPDSPASLTPTTVETRQQMLDLLTSSSHKQLVWQAAKAQAFSPFASVRPAILLEDWSTIESYSLQELLPCLAICAFMTGELNHGFSADEIVHALVHDSSFQAHATLVSDSRDTQAQLMLSNFHLFDRGLGSSQPDILSRAGTSTSKQRGSLWIEATGAPLLLTTAFVTAGCKTFLEKNACSLHGFEFLPVTGDMHILTLINTMHRLEECDRNEYLPPLRPKRGSMPPPSRRLSSLPPSPAESKPQASAGKSISQVGVLFIREMVQVMQKWKLGASLHRTVPLQYRHILGDQTPATPPGRGKPASQSAGAPPLKARSPKSSAAFRQSQTAERQDPLSTPADHGSTSNGIVNVNSSEGSLSHAQSFSNGFQTSFISGLPQQSHSSGATAPANGGQGGMFDIPVFDLFEPVSAIEWTNNVPWFDPIDNGVPAPNGVSLPSFANGDATTQWGQYQQSPSMQSPLQSEWPSQPRKRSADTLPPLHYASMHQPPALPLPSQPHAYNGSHPAYTLPAPSSSQDLGSAHGEPQQSGIQTQGRPYANNGAHHHYEQQQQQQQQQHHYPYQQQQQYQHQRSYYGGGGSVHGGRILSDNHSACDRTQALRLPDDTDNRSRMRWRHEKSDMSVSATRTINHDCDCDLNLRGDCHTKADADAEF
ncbi:potential fungal zinc cluster transcription factor [Pseudozyma hubeiensis SY62]|uniref:Potential fungal zinc cluster transcription factor n=1 Tax=Pseudozyma hubeiensis (strain SY62) TaxID=1305764 RepID=R9NXZ0_PSEHS|nr:potential fungal zinc cluster transcription factor [Pseudozyma hubeiensis SY62]GAC93608.1 potential fungal zinc cluster transcription factor [Pseudozyma hubeiensis SY62]